MALNPRIPKFGNWEDADTIQYTQYFEAARKSRGAYRSVNHNSMSHIPGIFTPKTEPGRGARAMPGSPAVGSKTLRERRRSWDETAARILPHHRHLYEENASSPSIGRSRPRTRDRGQGMPERGSALPKFGEWDEKGPSSAEGYTRIFDRVREDKQTGLGQQPDTANDVVYPHYDKQRDNYEPSGCLCFGWCKK
ncbi:RPM1-interacting protein 4 [Rhynchospora pubera]|uniref:RPM1-interacting protein 4 n=1 Tax=Rhynchospora pubera TaxID=906938 RepID=A0AAV8EJ39_9POAL|nr:RPM1-interacting protein 4 [Rhynchospora pubera]